MNLIEEALVFATKAHQGQTRKTTHIPYILHPAEVGAIIATITENEDIIAAGILHDTVEDCNVDPRDIKRRFGARVAALVQSETEDKLSDRPPEETWLERKADSLIMLDLTKDIDVKILWLGDKLSNMRSFYHAYLNEGDAMWNHFHQKDPKMHAWYYYTIEDCIKELEDTAAYKEYCDLVDRIFKERPDIQIPIR